MLHGTAKNTLTVACTQHTIKTRHKIQDKRTLENVFVLYLPRVDECDLHQPQEVWCVRAAYTACCRSLDLKDVRCRVGVENAYGVLSSEGAVLLGLSGHRVKILSAVRYSVMMVFVW